MASRDNEEDLLRSVVIQNAETILRARQRAEAELVKAKESLELRTQELAHSLSMMRATLESTTDVGSPHATRTMSAFMPCSTFPSSTAWRVSSGHVS